MHQYHVRFLGLDTLGAGDANITLSQPIGDLDNPTAAELKLITDFLISQGAPSSKVTRITAQ